MTTVQTPVSERGSSPDQGPVVNGREALERLMELIEVGDLEAVGGLVTDDFLMEWPQSGERFRGRDDALAAWRAQDEKPTPAGDPRIVGGGDTWVLMVPLAYGEEVHHYVGVFELKDGLLRRATEYFGAPFPPKEVRAGYLASD